jgi:MFS family permease
MAQGQSTSGPGGLRALYPWYVVFVLTLAYTCSFIDRQILTLLIEPIRRDLVITDTQMSLLGGLAFSILYTTMGIPLARLADRSNRRNLMTAGVGLWSLMTAACGLARGFWPLFGARVGVGVGEAALSPAAFSLLADYFRPQQLARAIGAYSTGVYFGAGLALMIGGAVIQRVSNAPNQVLPFIGEIFPWQLTFFVVGLLGLPIMLLMLTIREPARRGAAVTPVSSGTPALLAFIRANRATLVCHIGAFTLYGIAIGCYLFWSPSVMMRTHGWDAPRTGFTIGLLMFVLGTLGVFSGGWLADRLAQRGHRDAVLRAGLYGVLLGAPFIVATPLLEDDRWATASLGFAIYFLAFLQGLPGAALQLVTPNPLRAQMTAIYFFIGNLIANGLGPSIPALLADYLFVDPLKLGLALSWTTAVVVPLAGLLLFLGLAPYRASLARVADPVSVP